LPAWHKVAYLLVGQAGQEFGSEQRKQGQSIRIRQNDVGLILPRDRLRARFPTAEQERENGVRRQFRVFRALVPQQQKLSQDQGRTQPIRVGFGCLQGVAEEAFAVVERIQTEKNLGDIQIAPVPHL